jgi:hypothetical protein
MSSHSQDAVTINGQGYDPVTGLPLSSGEPQAADEKSEAVHVVHHSDGQRTAHHLHKTLKSSTTLRRKAVKKPVKPHALVSVHRPQRAVPVVNKHPAVRRFALHPVGAISSKKVMDIGPAVHPHVAKAHARSLAKEQSLTATLPTAAETKAEAIKHAVEQTHKTTKHHQTLRQRMRPRQQVTAILSATFALVLMAGYLTYLNLPSLSVRVAASQAGIDARYPDYHPDGYALNGPVTFTDGRVSMNFKANAGEVAYTINQSKSGWDNDAVLDNYVTPRAGTTYTPYNVRGLTIFTYKDDAAWVNGGILYTIEGDAHLSSDQIRHIATSLL